MRCFLSRSAVIRENNQFEDTMSPAFTLLIMMNNCFHDVATATLMASGVLMWVILRQLKDGSAPEVRSFVISFYHGISKIVTYSLLWITAGAIPRILTFRNYEWADANAGGHMSGLIVKHITALVILLAGVFLWISLTRRIREIEGRDKTT